MLLSNNAGWLVVLKELDYQLHRVTQDYDVYQCLGPDGFVEDGVLPLFNSFEGLSSVSQLVMDSNGYLGQSL